MAESVDALVSNTSGATHPGSTPGLGTKERGVHTNFSFSFSPHKYSVSLKIKLQDLVTIVFVQ